MRKEILNLLEKVGLWGEPFYNLTITKDDAVIIELMMKTAEHMTKLLSLNFY